LLEDTISLRTISATPFFPGAATTPFFPGAAVAAASPFFPGVSENKFTQLWFINREYQFISICHVSF
jgi:hypothetical protein